MSSSPELTKERFSTQSKMPTEEEFKKQVCTEMSQELISYMCSLDQESDGKVPLTFKQAKAFVVENIEILLRIFDEMMASYIVYLGEEHDEHETPEEWFSGGILREHLFEDEELMSKVENALADNLA